MLYLLKRSRRRKLNSKISFLQKNPVFKAKPSRRPQSLCVNLTKLPSYDEITRFDGKSTLYVDQDGRMESQRGMGTMGSQGGA
jgi:hypothetical protein